MCRLPKILAMLGLLALASGPLDAQAGRKKAPASRPEPQKAHQRQAWIRGLVKHVADADPVVRRSAQAALLAAGADALPQLKALAARSGHPAAATARSLVERIRRATRHSRPGGRQGGRSHTQRLCSALGRLGLAADVRGRADKVLEGFKRRCQEIGQQRMDGSLDRTEARAAYWNARKDLDAALRKILGAARMKRLQAELKGNRRDRGRGRGAG